MDLVKHFYVLSSDKSADYNYFILFEFKSNIIPKILSSIAKTRMETSNSREAI